ncbi:unnamed protein product, partial [Rotaria magnacalcarata]
QQQYQQQQYQQRQQYQQQQQQQQYDSYENAPVNYDQFNGIQNGNQFANGNQFVNESQHTNGNQYSNGVNNFGEQQNPAWITELVSDNGATSVAPPHLLDDIYRAINNQLPRV